MAFDPTRLNLGADEPTATTGDGRDPWQEVLARFSTVPAAKVLEAAEVVRGIAGSWAAIYCTDYGVEDADRSTNPRTPAPQQFKLNRLGQPGMPEINFVPYNWGTNRFAQKGGALLGHPISFSIVGPTAKRGVTKDWFWLASNNVPAPGSPNILMAMGSGGGPLDLTDLYGLTTLDPKQPLFVVVSLTGSPGELEFGGGIVDGGAGDGAPSTLIPAPAEFVIPDDETSKFEVFRVIAMDAAAGTLTLDPRKQLSAYFDFSGGSGFQGALRAITLLTPAAARMVALPLSGGPTPPLTGSPGLEQVFAIVPPEIAANDDLLYRYDQWTSAAFTEEWWTTSGDGTHPWVRYDNRPNLPIPKPVDAGRCRVIGEKIGGIIEVVADTGPGTMLLPLVSGFDNVTFEVGDLIRIHNVRVRGAGRLLVDGDQQASLESLIGWFELLGDASPGVLLVRRTAEVDPLTGQTFFGNSRVLALDPLAGSLAEGDGIDLDATVHKPVRFFWDGNQKFSFDRVDSARLTNIINPNWVARSLKEPDLLGGSRAARPDKALFDTSSSDDGASGSNANPGSLMDLGFRAVIFPPRIEEVSPGVWRVFPDYNRPVTSHEVLLDPTKPSEKQFIEVDYANGLVRLSHPVKDGSLLWPIENAAHLAAANPTGGYPLWICCVPYSMEPGQLGSGVRVTGGRPRAESTNCEDEPEEAADQTDVYSDRAVFPLRDQTITSVHNYGAGNIIVLDGHVGNQLPSTGFVELLWGSTPDGEPLFEDGPTRGSLFGYQWVTQENAPDQTTLRGVYGGAHYAVSTAVVDGDNPAVAILRRDVALPNNPEGTAGTDYRYDVTYGAAKRATTVRFDDADVQANTDGTTTVRPRNTVALNTRALMSDLFRNWLLTGGEFSYSDPATTFTVAEAYLLVRGRRVHVPAVTYDFSGLPLNNTYYAYYDVSSGCPEFKVENTSLPLGPDAILIEAFYCMLKLVPPPPFNRVLTGLRDLRNPLYKIDERFELLVGAAIGQDTYHFETLGEAIAYANEIMTPTAGSAGFRLFIKVVGATVETGLIYVLTDGLVVEGDSAKASAFIGWSGSGPLIDLYGHHNLVFRGLYFLRGAVPAADDVYVFKNSLLSEGVVIEDNYSLGNWTGLFYSTKTAPDTAGLTLSRIAHNRAASVSSTPGANYLVYVGGTGASNVGLEITGNTSPGSISVGHDAQIRGNLLSGDIVTSYGSILEGNTCAGISLKPDPAGGRSGPSRVLNNTCNNLTLEDGDGHLVLGNRIGAVLSVTSGSQHTISDNWVGFEDTDGGYIEAVGALDDLIIQGNHIQGYNNAGTHYGIRITGGTGHTVSGNIMVWFDDFFGEINLTGCSESRVTGNRSAAIKVSQNCIVADNEVLADNAPVTGDLIWVSNTGCTVTGNRALGVTSTGTLNPATDADPNQAAGGTAVSGNRFSSVTGLFGQATTALQPAVLPGPVVQVAYGLNNVW